MTGMDDLVTWLRAQLDEDERYAREARPGPWTADGGMVYVNHPTDEVVNYTESAEHIARWDPARVLREVEAKRKIIDELERCGPTTDGHAGLRFAVQCLALPYADRSGYRDEWRP